jgi:hypothetical protein
VSANERHALKSIQSRGLAHDIHGTTLSSLLRKRLIEHHAGDVRITAAGVDVVGALPAVKGDPQAAAVLGLVHHRRRDLLRRRRERPGRAGQGRDRLQRRRVRRHRRDRRPDRDARERQGQPAREGGVTVARLDDPEWLREQMAELAGDAEDNVKEDRAEAAECRDPDRAEMLCARADTAEHYGARLRQILAGKTHDEAFADAVREGQRAMRRRR